LTTDSVRTSSPRSIRPELSPPHNLPEFSTSFVGRRSQLLATARLLEQRRVLTFVGPGGVGKSRLAVEIARRSLRLAPDGVWLVDVADVSEPDTLPYAIATAVGIVEGPLRPIQRALEQLLAERSTIILLDNCEHMISACAQMGEALIRACPRLWLLSTSREPLGTEGEHLVSVPPLSTIKDAAVDARRLRATEAAQLFADRARAVVDEFEINVAVAEDVATICHRLDGIPLALELAAARLRTMTVSEIASRLDDRFELLANGRRTAAARHQTLRGMVEWSTNLLNERQRTLLRRLAVFSGGWTRDAAVEICANDLLPRAEVGRELDALVDRSLVVLDNWHGTSRHRLLETLRAYAHDELVVADELTRLRRAHQEWFFARLRHSVSDFSADQVSWFNWTETEVDNIRSALDWCEIEPERVDEALYCYDGFWLYGDLRGLQQEVIDRSERLLALLPPASISAGRLIGEVCHCHALATSGAMTSAAERYQQVLEWAPQVKDARAQFWMNVLHCQLLLVRGDPASIALARTMQAHGRRDETGGLEPWHWWWMHGEGLLSQGEVQAARESLLTAVAEMPVIRERGVALRTLGLLEFRAGNHRLGADYLRQSLRCFAPFPDLRGYAVNLEELACVAAAGNHWERAARLFGAADSLFDLISSINLPIWQLHPEEAMMRCSERLGEAAFASLFEDGRAMAVERAVQYALEPDDAPTADTKSSILTRREREVAGAIARGWSNRQIAEALVISERTVDTHLSHIYGKLGLRSRTSLALWLTQHQTR
jgi:predicted ATPase/DNA-binding CsgD family transcriptional regulator